MTTAVFLAFSGVAITTSAVILTKGAGARKPLSIHFQRSTGRARTINGCNPGRNEMTIRLFDIAT